MTSLKKLLKALLNSTGFDVVHYAPEFNRPFDVLGFVVREELASGRPFFFVQIGANDGIVDDPLRELVVGHGLHGILIEPLPDIFQALRKNYADQEGLIFENVAISDFPGQANIYRFDASKVPRGKRMPKHWQGIVSFDKAHLLRERIPESYIRACLVETIPLRLLLERNRVSDFTLLQVDTEGFDYMIIKSALLAGYLPKIINYEHCWLPPKARLACKRLLDDYGYRFVEVGKDTLAIRYAD